MEETGVLANEGEPAWGSRESILSTCVTHCDLRELVRARLFSMSLYFLMFKMCIACLSTTKGSLCAGDSVLLPSLFPALTLRQCAANIYRGPRNCSWYSVTVWGLTASVRESFGQL